MPDLAEIGLAQTQQRGAIKLGVAADVVVYAGMEGFAVLVVPGFPGLILGLHEDGLRIPVVLLAPQEVAALDQQDALAAGRQAVRQRAAAGAAADDDDVVMALACSVFIHGVAWSGERWGGRWRSRLGTWMPCAVMRRYTAAASIMPASGAVKYSQASVQTPDGSADATVRAGFMLMPENGASNVTKAAISRPQIRPV